MSVPPPDLVRVQLDDEWLPADRSPVRVSCVWVGEGLAVDVNAARGVGVRRIQLRWRRDLPGDALVLGDAWERSYGELSWQPARPEQLHPWMVVVHSPGSGSWGAGVDVQTSSFAGWTVDPDGVSLWLDIQAGADRVVLDDRRLRAAVVRWVSVEGAYETQCALAEAVCPAPLPVGPLVGANNWYYAYGQGFGLDAVLRDALMLWELSCVHPVRT